MHDKNGNPLKVGDRVTVEGEITSTSASDEFCNVTLKIGEKGQEHGPHNVTGTLVVNAKQTSLLKEVYDKNGNPESEEDGEAAFLVGEE